ncbi:MAG: hypothetical protein ACRDDY_17110 [Clostridium sp.]|uniref:hypothetical protein n=1 Tax=Clostridium sp. TaxID=1506 RepID=UPI003EE578DC
MVNLISFDMSIDGTGVVTLTDGRELKQNDAFVVDKVAYKRFLEWEKNKTEERMLHIEKEIGKIRREEFIVSNNMERILKELKTI